MSYPPKNDVFDYDFMAETETEYKLNIDVEATSKIFKYVFNKSVPRMAKRGIRADTKIVDQVQEFEAPKEYFKLIKTQMGKFVQIVQTEISLDGVKILDYEVEKAVYRKEEDAHNWKIRVVYTGHYVKK